MQGLTSSPGDGGIAGLNILLVEDEFLLACSLEEDLRAAGAHVVGMYSGLTAARDGARRGGFAPLGVVCPQISARIFQNAERTLRRTFVNWRRREARGMRGGGEGRGGAAAAAAPAAAAAKPG